MRQQAHSAFWRGLKAALGLGATAVALLAFASAASAAVIVITPDNNSGSDHLTTAINTANSNSSTSNTIVLEPGTYQPATEPVTISKNLNIVADHTLQSSNSATAADIQGDPAQLKATNNLFVVNHGVTLRWDAIGCDGCGPAGYAAILDNGNVIWNGSETIGSNGYALQVTGIGQATLNESTVESNIGNAVDLGAGGSLTLNHSSIEQGSGDGIDIGGNPYTLILNNSLLAYQVGPECSQPATSTVTSLDDDGTCGVQYGDETGIDSEYPINPLSNGGPTATVLLPAGNPYTTGLGTNCPTTDQRFFVNPLVNGTIQCDIGAETNGATQQTTAPACVVTNTNESSTPATQQVSLHDSLSGVGPELGLATDNPSNTVEATYPPPAAASIPSYSVSNLGISNGTVAFTPFTLPSTNPLVLTASKTTAGTQTAWSFTGMNWAGIAKNCY